MKKPNVLFIPIDDLRPQLGCYGHPQMITPHLDGLAGRGVVFKQAYCQVPVCGATRASLLTGRRPRRDRFVNYMTWVDHDLPGARTLPQHFRENGYATVAVGKVFHHHPDTSERSWTCPPWLPAPAAQDNWRNYLTEESLANVNPDSGNGPPYERADVPDDAYFDGQIADQAISELHRLSQADEPFFLAAGFLKPHLPFNAPTKYWDYYRRDDVPLADNPFAPEGAPGQAMHDWGELRNYFNVPKDGPLPDEMARTLVHGYYAATSYMDAQIGRLLGELESLGLSDNTVVVAWGDHGWQLGEHGLWCKHCNFHTSLNAPLIIRAPGLTQGASAEGIVEFLDVFPTLCELGGLSTPESLQGTSLVPALGDPTRQIKPAAYCRYNDGDSIRADNYLYTEWTDDEGRIDARMLYDHDADPDENQNISECSGYAEEINRLSAMLAEIRSTD